MSARGAAAGLLVLLAACASTPPPAEPADESTRAIDAMLTAVTGAGSCR